MTSRRPPGRETRRATGPLCTLPAQSHPVVRRGHAGRPGDGPKRETCGSCVHAITDADRRRWKCGRARARWTRSASTDIALRDPACGEWQAVADHGEPWF